ncbi:MAG: ATP-dependent helicase [Acidimicrobiales bacterium]
MDAAGPEALLAGLTEPQRTAVRHDAGLLCVVAGAGSGKTTVLTRRVAWRVATGDAEADHVLVVTFTRKAARELRARLYRLGVESGPWAGTFHAAAFAVLRRHWADDSRRAPAVAGDVRRILRDVVVDAGLDDGAVAVVADEVAWARARMIGPDAYPDAAVRRSCALPAELVSRLMTAYATEKRRRGVVDLDDLVEQCTALLESGGPAAAAARWRFAHLFVDEFQDVNPAQWRLVEAWRDGRPDLTVVGDPRQAVYAWNGSDPTLITRLPSLVPGMATVRLDDNHRSTPAIVSAAVAALGQEPGGADVPRAASGIDGPPPKLVGFDDEDEEADAVARWLRAAHRPGRPWRHLAVLARTNARLEPVAAALTRAGIPFRRASANGPVGAVRNVLRALRMADRDLPLRAALTDLEPASIEEEEALGRLAGLVDEYALEEAFPTVGGFLAWLAANPSDEVLGGRSDAVALSTFHRAKGLEWPVVAVVGAEDGTIPLVYATTDAARAEERRLLYVALTRAERELWCSWAARPAGDDRASSRGPSPYLEAVRDGLHDCEPVPPDVATSHIAALRNLLVASAG